MHPHSRLVKLQDVPYAKMDDLVKQMWAIPVTVLSWNVIFSLRGRPWRE
jgi:hypothetical protein